MFAGHQWMEAAVLIGGGQTRVLIQWVMMGYANKCGGMQELGWWLFTSMGHKQGTCCFATMDVLALVVKNSSSGDKCGGRLLFRSNSNG